MYFDYWVHVWPELSNNVLDASKSSWEYLYMGRNPPESMC